MLFLRYVMRVECVFRGINTFREVDLALCRKTLTFRKVSISRKSHRIDKCKCGKLLLEGYSTQNRRFSLLVIFLSLCFLIVRANVKSIQK